MNLNKPQFQKFHPISTKVQLCKFIKFRLPCGLTSLHLFLEHPQIQK